MNSAVVVAKTLSIFENFLIDVIAQSNFELSEVNISSQDEWKIEDGALAHKSGGFFQVCGLTNQVTQKEELVLFQPQSALTGLVLCQKENTAFILLQARAEPGNIGVGQYGPTIQSTAANYFRMHGGKATSYFELFSGFRAKARLIDTTMQFDLGKRYFQKSKSLMYVEVDELIETDPNMIWVPLSVIQASLAKDNFLNPDLRSLLCVFNWNKFLGCPDIETSSSAPIDFLTRILHGKEFGCGSWNTLPLNQLNNWEVTDAGILNKDNSDVSVKLFQTVCKTREVSQWVQPLMIGSGQGLVKLLMRQHNGETEFLLSLQKEFGISGQQTITPTYLIYPGEKVKPEIMTNNNVVAEFFQSEEGGRFIAHESVYQLCLIEDEMLIQDNQYWVNAYTLKKLLSTSNNVSIQLRCISSLLIDIINPEAFC